MQRAKLPGRSASIGIQTVVLGPSTSKCKAAAISLFITSAERPQNTPVICASVELTDRFWVLKLNPVMVASKAPLPFSKSVFMRKSGRG